MLNVGSREQHFLQDCSENSCLSVHTRSLISLRRFGSLPTHSALRRPWSDCWAQMQSCQKCCVPAVIVSYDDRFKLQLITLIDYSDIEINVTIFTLSIWTQKPEQTVQTLIRRRIMRRLIRIYTVCHSPSIM